MNKELNKKINEAYKKIFLTEQTFVCPECGSTMKSTWKEKAKCAKCGAEMKVKGH
jgi:tRNA(Ile2) C34 agmatinyltransferase TiaS